MAQAKKAVKRPLGPLGRLIRFVRQVAAELRQVVRPTRQELWTYSRVVVVFVLIVMAFIFGVDWLTNKGVMALFG
ncbi:MAG: preprotein translocase subunit SecE [Bifidobacteriaceae bacterium]|jgi:preprotein translocase subunit SecE|nr:preprotein translocase subunit SecE [Bifidobacteriaceae bacterium]